MLLPTLLISSSRRHNSEGLSSLCGSVLNDFQRRELERNFTRSEIKEAFFHMNSNKTPGPDGYNSFFFRETWQIIGADIEEAALEFFLNNKMLGQANNTAITLVPKVKNPSTL